MWNCLYKCLAMDDSWKRYSDWHKVDDVMMTLLQRIAFEGNICRSTILFYFAAKFAALPHPRHHIIDELSGLNEMDRRSFVRIDWDELRNDYQKFDSLIIYKWVKKMLLLIGSQNMFYGDDFEVTCKLQVSFLHYTILRSCYTKSLSYRSSISLTLCGFLRYDCHWLPLR